MQGASATPKAIQGYESETHSPSLSLIEQLPEEILLTIFEKCTPRDIRTLALVCHTFHNLTKDRTILNTIRNIRNLQSLEKIRGFEKTPEVFCEYKQIFAHPDYATPLRRSGNFLVYYARGQDSVELFDIQEKKHLRTIKMPDVHGTVFCVQDTFLYMYSFSQGIMRWDMSDTSSQWETVLPPEYFPLNFHVYPDCIMIENHMSFEGIDPVSKKLLYQHEYQYLRQANYAFFDDLLIRYDDKLTCENQYYQEPPEPISIIHPTQAILPHSEGLCPRCITDENLLLTTNEKNEIVLFDIRSNIKIDVIPIHKIIPEIKGPLAYMDLSSNILFFAEKNTLYVVDTTTHSLIKTFQLKFEIIALKTIGEQLYCATKNDLVLFDFSSISLNKQDEQVKAHIDPIEEPTTFCEILSSFVDRIERCVRSLF